MLRVVCKRERARPCHLASEGEPRKVAPPDELYKEVLDGSRKWVLIARSDLPLPRPLLLAVLFCERLFAPLHRKQCRY